MSTQATTDAPGLGGLPREIRQRLGESDGLEIHGRQSRASARVCPMASRKELADLAGLLFQSRLLAAQVFLKAIGT